jgi:hypothetical protein
VTAAGDVTAATGATSQADTGNVADANVARFEPYYTLFHAPDTVSSTAAPTFSLIRPFVPFSSDDTRKELRAFMVVSSDPETYGQLKVYKYDGTLPAGPATVSAELSSNPSISPVITLLNQQGLGTVQTASVSIPWWRPQSYYDQAGRGTLARDGGGVLITQAIHSLDVFRALVGVRRVVAAQASRTRVHRMETEDHVQALLELGQGAPGRLMATTAHYPGGTECIEVIGTLGTAVLSGGDLRVNFINGDTPIEIKAEGGTGGGANIMDFPHDWHRDLISDFVASIQQQRPSRTHGGEALQTHQLIDDLLAAAGPVIDL